MFSTTLPEVDDNLLHFADIEGEIIVVAPIHQILSFLYSVSLLLKIRPTMVESSANLKIKLEGNLATQS